MKRWHGIALLMGTLFVATPHRPTWASEARARPARFISVEQLRIAKASHKGRILVIHFWATWCGPCVKELPLLARLARDARSRGVDFLPISLDEPTERGASWVGRVLAAKTGDPWWSPILKWQGEEDAFTTEFDGRWQGEIPAFFVYDREGRLHRSMIGDLGRGDFDRLVGDLLIPNNK